MQIYDMSKEYAEGVRKELNSSNEDGIFSHILKKLNETFKYTDYFYLDPNDLKDLAGRLQVFKKGDFVSDVHTYVEGVGNVVIFDFYTDICNVFELIRDSIDMKFYQQPILFINKNRIADRLKELVRQYLTREKEEE